jgi:hypothetical protein
MYQVYRFNGAADLALTLLVVIPRRIYPLAEYVVAVAGFAPAQVAWIGPAGDMRESGVEWFVHRIAAIGPKT